MTTMTPMTWSDTMRSEAMKYMAHTRAQNKKARIESERDGTFEPVTVCEDGDVMVVEVVEAAALVEAAGEAGEAPENETETETELPPHVELWNPSEAVCAMPYVDAPIVISDDDEEAQAAQAAQADEVTEVGCVSTGERLPFSAPFMLPLLPRLPRHEVDQGLELACLESPVSPAASETADDEAVEAVKADYIDTVARRRASNEALRAGFAKARADIEAVEAVEAVEAAGAARGEANAEVLAP